MSLRRPRNSPPPKPVPVAALVLYAGDDLWSRWARLLFLEKEVADSRVERLGPGKPLNEDMLVLNPEQRLPAIADREVVLTGARVISEYLEERYPHPRLLPNEPLGRARARMALDRFEQELFPLLATASAGEKAPARAAKARLDQVLVASARSFSARGWFLGPEFSLADGAWAVWLQGVFALGIVPPPAVRDYAERLAKRPSVRKLFADR